MEIKVSKNGYWVHLKYKKRVSSKKIMKDWNLGNGYMANAPILNTQ